MEKLLLNPALFDKLIVQQQLQCIVCIFTRWSGKSHIMRRMLNNISDRKPRNISFFGLDKDNHPVLVQKMGIQSVPTLLFFKKGELISEINGLVAESEILGLIEDNFNMEAA